MKYEDLIKHLEAEKLEMESYPWYMRIYIRTYEYIYRLVHDFPREIKYM